MFLFINSLTLQAEEAIQEIIVTGSRLLDYNEMPAVTLVKTADFLAQEIRISNDSRSPEIRRKEIYQSIDNLIKASKKANNIELSYGEGFLTDINLNDESFVAKKKVVADFMMKKKALESQ